MNIQDQLLKLALASTDQQVNDVRKAFNQLVNHVENDGSNVQTVKTELQLFLTENKMVGSPFFISLVTDYIEL